jgi:hypothetical protein
VTIIDEVIIFFKACRQFKNQQSGKKTKICSDGVPITWQGVFEAKDIKGKKSLNIPAIILHQDGPKICRRTLIYHVFGIDETR